MKLFVFIQVATDMRLWLRDSALSLISSVSSLITSFSARATQHIDVLIPGYTHLQRAQPIRFSHWLLSHAWPLVRDTQRLKHALERIQICPLGSGALAGNPFHIARSKLAEDLGFDQCSDNR